jgi:hypothetical protein
MATYASYSSRMDRGKSDQELALHVKKMTSPEETSPKQKHVRGTYRVGLQGNSRLSRKNGAGVDC